MGSAQTKVWEFLQKHGRATSYAIASDPNNDISVDYAGKLLRDLRHSGAVRVVGYRKKRYNFIKVYEIKDEVAKPNEPEILDV